MNGDDNCNFDCFVTTKITNQVAAVPQGQWLREFLQCGVTFNDTSDSAPIEVLIGNDIAPHLYSMRKVELNSGPVAMETRWGWVLGVKGSPEELKETALPPLHLPLPS